MILNLKGERVTAPGVFTIKETSLKVVGALLRNSDLAELYRRAVRQFGEGEMHSMIMETAMSAMDDEGVRDEALSSSENLFSLLCGIWVQFLLSEVAGVQKDRLQAIVREMLSDVGENKIYH